MLTDREIEVLGSPAGLATVAVLKVNQDDVQEQLLDGEALWKCARRLQHGLSYDEDDLSDVRMALASVSDRIGRLDALEAAIGNAAKFAEPG